MVGFPVEDQVLTDPRRVAAVRRTELALAARLVSADAAAHLAARALDTPAALVSLVRADDIHLAGLFGAPAALMDARELPLTGSLCPVVVTSGRPLIVGDTSTHPEYAAFDAVTRYQVGAYLGVPLRDAAGQALGAVAVFDTRARQWTDDDLLSLIHLTELIGPLPQGDPFLDERSSTPAALDTLGEVLIGVDDAGVVLAWNTAAQRMFGFTPHEALHQPIERLLFTDGAWPRLRAAARDTGNSAPLHRQRLRARRRDGGTVAVKVSTSPVDTPTGRHWALIVFDATEHAQLDQRAERQSAFLHTVLDTLDTAVIACDADGQLVLLNQAMRQAHGVSHDAVPADPRQLETHLLYPDGTPLPLPDTPLLRALAGHRVRDADVVIRPAGTRARRFVANATPIRDQHGTVIGAAAALHDVTAQRRTECFRECELQVATLLAGADSVQNVGERITETVARTLRWPHVELWLLDPVTDTLNDAGHWTAPGAHVAGLITDTITKGIGITGTVWAGGQPMWVPDLAATDHLTTADAVAVTHACTRTGLRTVVAVPIHDGTLIGVLTCFADTREYDQDELIDHLARIAEHIGRFVTRRHAANLGTQLDRTREDFIALVGHELRTPLTSIAANTQLLLDDAETLGPDVAQMVATIDRNTTSLTAIVDALLDLAALQSAHISIHPRPTDVVTVLHDCLTDIGAAAHANHVTLTADLPNELIIDVDPQRFRQACDNVLSNAVKYSPGGGAVTVHLTTEPDVAVLTVTDTGIGIPPEQRTQLFRRFFRASNARHTTIGGAGLGLVITRTIVEAHHGTITATHRHPGTEITVRLPRRPPDGSR
ncbi:ATP-binding protein [Actinoplanes xinjiangensis]|uniref:ATP-binding protein n=1 Tax=Actinoplanes xinjiangensis TaxID=512350 RepID=UPI00341594E6